MTASARTVAVSDIDLGDGGRPAYLVRPESSPDHGAAGIVWFHWIEYGAPTSNRTEFLEEARAMAARGVVSILVDGTFPWFESPQSIAHDTVALEADLATLRAAYGALIDQPGVDPTRTALAGHDFGSMYESVLFSEDSRPLGLVMMAPTARWADWFAKYWQIEDDVAAYGAALAPYDPVTVLPDAVDRPILLQFATQDQYVPPEVAAEISRAAGTSAETREYETGHEMDESARIDRDAWLAELLGLDGAE